MPRKAIGLAGNPLSNLPFSPAVWAGGLLFLSGQIGFDAAAGKLVAGGVGAECAQIFANLKTVLAAADKTLDDVVKATVYLSDMADYAAMNEIYARSFAVPYPARTAIAVAGLPFGARVEMDIIAD
jgi:2-iminobutanoate/2-iminopropanoate deaminase